MFEWIVILLVVPFIIGMVGALVKRHVLGPKSEWPVRAPEPPVPPGGAYRDNVKPKTFPPGSGFTGFRRFYFVTLGWHPLVVGALVGLVGHFIGIPVPPGFSDSIGGALVAYLFAGGVASIGYDTIVKTIKRIISGISIAGAGGGASKYDDTDDDEIEARDVDA